MQSVNTVPSEARVMINQNWWFTTLLVKQFKYCPPLDKDITCDVLLVGGGVSGISAAVA